MLHRIMFGLIVGIVMLGGFATAQAAPFTLDENLKPHELKFHEVEGHPGVLGTGAKGVLGNLPQYIVVNNMTVYRQSLATIAATGDKPVTLDIVKNTWGEVLKHCEATADDSCDIDFRTGGDAGFKISGPAGASYELVLLAGGEHPVEETLKSPIYPVSKEEINKMGGNKKVADSEEKSDGSSFQTIVIAMLSVLILLVLIGVVLLMKRKPTLQSFLFLVFLAGTLLPYVSYAGAGLTNDGIFEESKAIGDIADKALKRLDVIEKGANLAKTWLDKCEITGNPPGEPRIPSFCAGDETCQQCYHDARTNFNKVRATLEKLRVIYACSTNFSKSAIAFGDSSSGIHAVVGLAWQQQKLEIQKSVTGLNKAYDHKYIELMKALNKSMTEMGACEQKYGVEDWYDRFGFVYYEFMKDKYKRAD